MSGVVSEWTPVVACPRYVLRVSRVPYDLWLRAGRSEICGRCGKHEVEFAEPRIQSGEAIPLCGQSGGSIEIVLRSSESGSEIRPYEVTFGFAMVTGRILGISFRGRRESFGDRAISSAHAPWASALLARGSQEPQALSGRARSEN
ncbi:hypothetical protein KM043_000570 [Ampulex compressa]|nr:hypothetical protein KM043_000570 [Ampulex compressa]